MYIFKDLPKKKKPFNLKKLMSIKLMKGFSKLFLKFDLEEKFYWIVFWIINLS